MLQFTLGPLKDTQGPKENLKRLLRIARRATSDFQHQDTLTPASDVSPRLSYAAGSKRQDDFSVHRTLPIGTETAKA